MILKTIIIFATLMFAIAAGVLLVALYSNVADTGGSVVGTISQSASTGNWGWVTDRVMVGAWLIGLSVVGFLGFAAVVVRRSLVKAKDVRGFETETK
jgi:hypothetical protein